MPGFSFLKSSKGEQQPRPRQRAAPHDSAVQLSSDSAEKVQRKQSKRDYFRNLLKISSLSSESRANRRKSGQFTAPTTQQPPSPSKSPDPPVSPMNKPLPPPPPASTQADSPPIAKPPVKLERIISPIDVPDLHKIFSGAPQFFARAEGHNTGAPHPSVAFPWDEELNIRDLTDFRKIHDEAWSCVTAWPHVTVRASRNPESVEENREKERAHFLPRCRERPNMLSMQGLERGTVGFQAALEMGVADALEIPGEDTDTSPEYISEQRKVFLNGKDGLRPVTDSILLERLQQASEVYHDDPQKHQKPSVELYTQLFTFILFPPSRVTEHDDPYSLKIQIEALVEVLAAPTVWIDFSLVEWRIRLGQILWGASAEADPEDEVSVNNEIARDPGTERYWLLLQILLSCELLLRLDAISVNMDHGVKAATPVEIHRFEKLATPSVRWSLILARAWLENIRLGTQDSEALREKRPAGWLATLRGTGNTEAVSTDGLQELTFHGRHESRQLSGLLHFARNIHWPDMDDLTSKVASNGITISDSIQNTPIATPLSISTQRSSSYFARRPVMKRGMSLQRHVSTIIRPAGWLSNSYISGFILPGEGLSHFLMSTLLENDSDAVSRLGEEANLYGGFIYRSKSFWSSACIIGRVLAGKKGSSECMGWIQSNVVPRGVREGWVDVDVEPEEPIDPSQKSGKPRLWQKQNVEHDGHVIGGADFSSVLPGDFILPSDESSQTAISVTFESLDLFTATDSGQETPTEDKSTPLSEVSLAPSIKTYSAMMRFTIVASGEDKKEANVALNHDIHFVTAHPCIPSPHVDILKTAMSPALVPSPSSRSGNQDAITGHPLHKAFTYTKISLSTLLATPLSTPFNTLLSPPPLSPSSSSTPSSAPQSSTHTTSSTIPKVLIIDCTDQSMSFFPVVHRPSESVSAMASRDASALDLSSAPSPSSKEPSSPLKSPSGSEGGREGDRRRKSDVVKEKKAHREYGSDLEMLGRALCAERGWDAVVSRRGRGCLACAVREVGALGWRVVLRVA
ncbi:hypothetical protein BKA64DRAFT_742685 [Cadophora sp. MPI-SDFR-AT-0126]|nr:hypothetical protein BKA64DRAFT_742685 [Leotiomycetes sp. MPI-SDFR-AT-0126]